MALAQVVAGILRNPTNVQNRKFPGLVDHLLIYQPGFFVPKLPKGGSLYANYTNYRELIFGLVGRAGGRAQAP
jgi:hypothetical protein